MYNPPNKKKIIIKLPKIIWFISNNEYTIKKKLENSTMIPATSSLSLSLYSKGILPLSNMFTIINIIEI